VVIDMAVWCIDSVVGRINEDTVHWAWRNRWLFVDVSCWCANSHCSQLCLLSAIGNEYHPRAVALQFSWDDTSNCRSGIGLAIHQTLRHLSVQEMSTLPVLLLE